MEERTITLQNTHYLNVLNYLEEHLCKLPRPVHIDEKPGKSVTRYFFQDPVRTDSTVKQSGRITINCSKTTTTQYAAITGPALETDPMIFECDEDAENNHVVVKGYCSTHTEGKDWIKPIFDKILQDLERIINELMAELRV